MLDIERRRTKLSSRYVSTFSVLLEDTLITMIHSWKSTAHVIIEFNCDLWIENTRCPWRLPWKTRCYPWSCVAQRSTFIWYECHFWTRFSLSCVLFTGKGIMKASWPLNAKWMSWMAWSKLRKFSWILKEEENTAILKILTISEKSLSRCTVKKFKVLWSCSVQRHRS